MSIEVKQINYVYSEGTAYQMHALKDVNLTIPAGQFVGLIGHTGSGKSTLVQHLNGLIRATSGEICFNGQNIYAEKYSMRQLYLYEFHNHKYNYMFYLLVCVF